MYVWSRRTNSTSNFPCPNTAKNFDSGCESIIRTFLGAAGSCYFVSFHPLKKGIQEKGRKEEGSDRSERLIKMIGFNIVLGL
jgi:hypothetical protein